MLEMKLLHRMRGVNDVNTRTDLVAKGRLETHDQLAFELKLRTRQSLGEDVRALKRGLHSSHLDLTLFQMIAEPMVFDSDQLGTGCHARRICCSEDKAGMIVLENLAYVGLGIIRDPAVGKACAYVLVNVS
jgi:hypothetical protein